MTIEGRRRAGRQWGSPPEEMAVLAAKSRAARARRLEALIEDVEELIAAHRPVMEISTRVGRSPAAIARAMYRADRADLARPFQLLYERQRRQAA